VLLRGDAFTSSPGEQTYIMQGQNHKGSTAPAV